VTLASIQIRAIAEQEVAVGRGAVDQIGPQQLGGLELGDPLHALDAVAPGRVAPQAVVDVAVAVVEEAVIVVDDRAGVVGRLVLERRVDPAAAALRRVGAAAGARLIDRAADVELHGAQLELAALHRAAGRPAVELVEQGLAGFAAHHRVGDAVGVLLVAVADLADAAAQLHAGLLLQHVRRLVRRGVQRRCAGERDVRAGRECLGAHRARAGRGALVGVRVHAGHVVAAERALDHRRMSDIPLSWWRHW
jgi:hypothetical protein